MEDMAVGGGGNTEGEKDGGEGKTYEGGKEGARNQEGKSSARVGLVRRDLIIHKVKMFSLFNLSGWRASFYLQGLHSH